jgi:hypothetical protein
MSSISSENERVGLCVSCQHMQLVRTDRGSVFYQCQRSTTDLRYPKYPRLPVLQCPGYGVREESQRDGAATRHGS